MTITTKHLTAVAGLCAAAAGAIFIGVQINHPHLDVTTIATTDVVIRDALKVLMAALALAGISGMYLSQVRRNGVLGLIGYLALATRLPPDLQHHVRCHVRPAEYRRDRSRLRRGRHRLVHRRHSHRRRRSFGRGVEDPGPVLPRGRSGLWRRLVPSACSRRWATVLLAVGGLISVALSFMPDAFYRLLALPNGIAMIGLGYSLWRAQRQSADHAPHRRRSSPADRSLMTTEARRGACRWPWWRSAPSRWSPADCDSSKCQAQRPRCRRTLGTPRHLGP